MNMNLVRIGRLAGLRSENWTAILRGFAGSGQWAGNHIKTNIGQIRLSRQSAVGVFFP
jgi:hypothetical protein